MKKMFESRILILVSDKIIYIELFCPFCAESINGNAFFTDEAFRLATRNLKNHMETKHQITGGFGL